MTQKEKREQSVQMIAEMLRTTPFQVEFKVKKNPTGIKVIFEVTQEQMDATVEHVLNRTKTQTC